MPNRSDQPTDPTTDLKTDPKTGFDSQMITPREITQASDRQLSITWADGHQSLFDVRELRLACGCASCVDEWTGEDRLDTDSVPDDVHPIQIDSVGRYAIQIRWSDGHDTGIYPFDRLRALSASQADKRPPG